MTGKAGSQIARSCRGAPHIHSADRAPFAEDNCASGQPFEVTRVTDADAWNRLACFRFLESDHPDILYFAGFSSGEKENGPPRRTARIFEVATGSDVLEGGLDVIFQLLNLVFFVFVGSLFKQGLRSLNRLVRLVAHRPEL